MLNSEQYHSHLLPGARESSNGCAVREEGMVLSLSHINHSNTSQYQTSLEVMRTKESGQGVSLTRLFQQQGMGSILGREPVFDLFGAFQPKMLWNLESGFPGGTKTRLGFPVQTVMTSVGVSSIWRASKVRQRRTQWKMITRINVYSNRPRAHRQST